MDPIFTDYVRSLNPGDEPDAEHFALLWSTLRGALYAEMRKRALWKVPPSRFGAFGWNSWSEAGAFDELVSDCYTFIFLERLPALKAQLQVKDNVEGLVFRNIQNFLYDIQKKNDPIGFRTYKVLASAVRTLIETRRLHIVAGGPRLHGETVLAFARDETATVAIDAELEGCAREWCDDLAIGIVTARGRKKLGMVGALAARIAGLRSGGAEAFRWKSLADAVKGAVRARWYALGARLEGETAFEKVGAGPARRVRVVAPELAVEERQSYANLCAFVARRLECPGGDEDVAAGDLRRLWTYLRRDVAESGTEKIPSRRQTARELGVSRHKLAGQLAVLGRWVHRCQTGSPGRRRGRRGLPSGAARRAGLAAGGVRPGRHAA